MKKSIKILFKMAEYLINLAGNCCELFIILFFLKDNYKLRVKKNVAILLCGLFLLFQFVSNNLFLGESPLIIFSTMLFTLLVTLVFKIKIIYRILFTVLICVFNMLSEASVAMILTTLLDVDIAYTQSNMLIFAICTLASKFLTYVFVLFTKLKRFKNSDETINHNTLWLFLLPISSVLIMLLFLKCCYQIDDTSFKIITLITSLILAFASAVYKRIQKIATAYEDFVSKKYGEFLDIHSKKKKKIKQADKDSHD